MPHSTSPPTYAARTVDALLRAPTAQPKEADDMLLALGIGIATVGTAAVLFVGWCLLSVSAQAEERAMRDHRAQGRIK